MEFYHYFPLNNFPRVARISKVMLNDFCRRIYMLLPPSSLLGPFTQVQRDS